MSWRLVKLGYAITQRKEFITIDDSKEYKRCRVQVNRKGVVLRDVVKGISINTKKQQLCKEGDFLVAEIDAKVGGYGFVPKDLEDAIVSSHYFLFEVDESKMLKGYLTWLIKTEIIQEQINSKGSTNYAAIRPKNVLDFEIPLPTTIEEQQTIVDKLDSVYQKHSNIEKQLDQQQSYLQLLRQTILQEAVQGRLTKQDANDEPASKLLKRIKAEKQKLIKERVFQNPKETGEIEEHEFPYKLPSNWTKAKLVDLCFVTKLAGFEFTKYIKLTDQGEVPVIRAQNVRKGFIEETNLKYIDLATSKLLNRCALDTVCLLITFIGAGIGDVAVFNKRERWHLAPNVAKAVPFNYTSDKVDVNYLCFYLLSSIGQNELFKFNKATAQPSLSMSTIRQAIVALPPIAEQQRIVTKVLQLQQQLDALETQVQQSRQYAQQLLQAVLKEAFATGTKNYKENETLSLAAEA